MSTQPDTEVVARAGILHPGSEIMLEQRPLPPLGDGLVLIEDIVCGICGTDVAKYKGEEPITEPVWLGHEFGGRVAAIGRRVKRLKVGQTVAAWISPEWPYGGLADRTVVEARHVVPLDRRHRHLLWAVEPLSCAIGAVLRTDPPDGPLKAGGHPLAEHGYRRRAHRDIAVVGTGAMGLMAAALSMLERPARLTVIGRSDEGLRRAKRLLRPMASGGTGLEFLHTADAPSRYDSADVVYEAIGTPETLATANRLARMGGFVSVMGYHQSGGGRRELDMGRLVGWRAVSLLSGHTRDADTAGLPPEEDPVMPAMRLAASLIDKGAIDPTAIAEFLIWRLEDANTALESASRGGGKVIIDSARGA